MLFYNTNTAAFSVDTGDKEYDGKWVVQTNDDTLMPEGTICSYKDLTAIE